MKKGVSLKLPNFRLLEIFYTCNRRERATAKIFIGSPRMVCIVLVGFRKLVLEKWFKFV